MDIDGLDLYELKRRKTFNQEKISYYIQVSQSLFDDEVDIYLEDIQECKKNIEEIDKRIKELESISAPNPNDFIEFKESILPQLRKKYKVVCFWDNKWFFISRGIKVYEYHPEEGLIFNSHKQRRISLNQFRDIFLKD